MTLEREIIIMKKDFLTIIIIDVLICLLLGLLLYKSVLYTKDEPPQLINNRAVLSFMYRKLYRYSVEHGKFPKNLDELDLSEESFRKEEQFDTRINLDLYNTIRQSVIYLGAGLSYEAHGRYIILLTPVKSDGKLYFYTNGEWFERSTLNELKKNIHEGKYLLPRKQDLNIDESLREIFQR